MDRPKNIFQHVKLIANAENTLFRLSSAEKKTFFLSASYGEKILSDFNSEKTSLVVGFAFFFFCVGKRNKNFRKIKLVESADADAADAVKRESQKIAIFNHRRSKKKVFFAVTASSIMLSKFYVVFLCEKKKIQNNFFAS